MKYLNIIKDHCMQGKRVYNATYRHTFVDEVCLIEIG